METILEVTYLLLLVLLLALLIERAMEVVMTCWNWLELRFNGHTFWNRRAERLKDRFAKRVATTLDYSSVRALWLHHRIDHYTDTPQQVSPGRTVVFSSRAVRHVFVRTFAFVVTTVLGILLCSLAGLNLVEIVKELMNPFEIPLLDWLGERAQLIVSGLVVGLGAEPVHRIIKGLEDSKAWLEQRRRLTNALAEDASISRS